MDYSPSDDFSRSPVAQRMIRCVNCHQRVSFIFASKHQGVCALCLEEDALLSWRLVYDRDRGIGQIPRNLRRSYGL